jgi:hypothetical protein
MYEKNNCFILRDDSFVTNIDTGPNYQASLAIFSKSLIFLGIHFMSTQFILPYFINIMYFLKHFYSIIHRILGAIFLLSIDTD